MKKILFVLTAITVILPLISCKHEIIPDPDPDPLKVDKYGACSATIDYCNFTDGVYYYGDTYITTTDQYGITSSDKVFGKRDYPYGTEWTPACTDPLCTHKSGSGCPLSACGGGRFVCYEGKILFYTLSGGLYVYDKTTNKSVKTADNFFNARFYKQDGGLYAVFNRESRDFDVTRVFAKISSDGAVTELGELNDYYGTRDLIYAERYAVDIKRTDDENTHKAEIVLHDLTTKEQKIVAVLDFPQAKRHTFSEVPIMIYGDKLYITVNYREYITVSHSEKEQDEEISRKNSWLIDLKTGEKRLLCTPDIPTYGGLGFVFCCVSDKCISWYEPRPTKETPFVLHILFPAENVEETYNLSEMAASIGETIDEDNFFTAIDFGAVRVTKYFSSDIETGQKEGIFETFRFDIVNGKAYKMDGEPTS